MVSVRVGQLEVSELAEAILQAEDDLLAVGCEVEPVPFARVLRDRTLSLIYDVNGLRNVRGKPTLQELTRAVEGSAGRKRDNHWRLVARDPATIQHLDALLLPRGFSRQVCVAMALHGEAPKVAVPKGLELVLAAPDDEDLLAAISHGQDLVRRDEIWYGVEVSRQMERLALRQMREGRAEFLAARTPEGEVVGSLLLRCDQGVGFIADVGTVPSWRRRGIASALVAAASALARMRGFSIVGLTARRDGSPRRIYADLGFITVGESVDWLRAGY